MVLDILSPSSFFLASLPDILLICYAGFSLSAQKQIVLSLRSLFDHSVHNVRGNKVKLLLSDYEYCHVWVQSKLVGRIKSSSRVAEKDEKKKLISQPISYIYDRLKTTPWRPYIALSIFSNDTFPIDHSYFNIAFQNKYETKNHESSIDGGLMDRKPRLHLKPSIPK